mmetsp:Transcript_89608/g.148976  ORF Transcript_89608/g.148976 Transcript_89608/m.148976 type:complete len:92 (+) Transcript_89608:484-759(+)
MPRLVSPVSHTANTRGRARSARAETAALRAPPATRAWDDLQCTPSHPMPHAKAVPHTRSKATRQQHARGCLGQYITPATNAPKPQYVLRVA